LTSDAIGEVKVLTTPEVEPDSIDVAAGAKSVVEEIRSLVELHREGVLSDEEFALLKARLLAK